MNSYHSVYNNLINEQNNDFIKYFENKWNIYDLNSVQNAVKEFIKYFDMLYLDENIVKLKNEYIINFGKKHIMDLLKLNHEIREEKDELNNSGYDFFGSIDSKYIVGKFKININCEYKFDILENEIEELRTLASTFENKINERVYPMFYKTDFRIIVYEFP